jgi:hypothetical protein
MRLSSVVLMSAVDVLGSTIKAPDKERLRGRSKRFIPSIVHKRLLRKKVSVPCAKVVRG